MSSSAIVKLPDLCRVCPKCPAACVVVYYDRKVFMNHNRDAAGHGGSMPSDQDLVWVSAVKTMHKGRVRWVKADSAASSIAVLPDFSMTGFRFLSKYERRVNLLERWGTAVQAEHPGFERGAIGRDLRFMQDAVLFLRSVQSAAMHSRYKVRQFAKRQPDGLLPTTGFNWLHCEDALKTYARTIARFLFYLTNSEQEGEELVSACHSLSTLVLQQEAADSQVRINAVKLVLLQSSLQAPSEKGFALEIFVQLYYVVAPNGFMNRSADFVRHICVHLIYGIRGAYILKCGERFDAPYHEELSEKFLNELHENAYSAIQCAKRLAVTCLDSAPCRILWQDDSSLQVQTERGNVSISVPAIQLMYHELLRKSFKVLSGLGIPLIGPDLLAEVVDVTTKQPGEGIMSMNQSLFGKYLNCHPQVENLRSPTRKVKDKKDFCSRVYVLGKLLVVALYLSGGPSARMTEISSWIVANTDNNSMRNVRYVRGAIAIINTYSKSDGLAPKTADSLANLACFSDCELTSLVLTYLIVVKRLEMMDAQEIPEFGEDAAKHSRLCFLVKNGQPIQAETLGKIFREEFLGQSIDVSIADMRHVLEAFARREGCSLAAEVGANVLLGFANHNQTTSNAVYGKSGKDLPEIAADRMEECHRYSQHWNKTILGSKVSASSSVAEAEQLSVGVVLTDGTAASSNDSSVSAAVSSAFALPLQVPAGNASTATTAVVAASSTDSRSSAAAASVTSPALKRPADCDDALTQPVRPKRSHIQLSVSLSRAMEALKLSTLKPTQVMMMEHLKANSCRHSIIVLPTGSGKSKVVLLDALDRGVCNLMFVPYVPIGKGLWEEGQSNPHLNIVMWDSIRHDFELAAVTANVVVASFEHGGQRMVSFVQKLQQRGRLGYSFVDEADVVLHAYRAFCNFWVLAASCSLVKIKAMTATLRPRDTPHVAKMLGIELSQVSELRQSCRRDDVVVSSRFYSDKRALWMGLKAYVSNLLDIPGAKVMIFVMTVKEAEDIGIGLLRQHPNDVSISHSKRRDPLKRIAVVTSCFTHGVNVEGLTHVVIFRLTWGVDAFVQVTAAMQYGCLKRRNIVTTCRRWDDFVRLGLASFLPQGTI